MAEHGATKLEYLHRQWYLTQALEYSNPCSAEQKKGNVTQLSNPGNIFNQQNRYLNPYFAVKQAEPDEAGVADA